MHQQRVVLFVRGEEVAASYHRLNPPGGGEGRPLVVIEPGLPLQWRSYSAMILDVVGQGFPVVVPTRLAFTATAPLGPELVPRVADVKRELLDHLDGGSGRRFVLISHSLGGAIDVATTLRAPELVDSLVQINPWGHPQMWRLHEYALIPMLSNLSLRSSRQLVLSTLDASANLGAQPVSYARMLLAAATLDTREDLRAVNGIPATIVVGERDFMVRPTFEAYCDLIGARRRLVVPGENHLLGARYPAQLRETVREALAEALQRQSAQPTTTPRRRLATEHTRTAREHNDAAGSRNRVPR